MTAPGSSSAERTWPLAAEGLARRATRRARAGAVLGPLAVGLGAGAVVVAAAKGAGLGLASDPRFAAASILGGTVAGMVVGLSRARREPRVSAADAAWALDRLADGRGRGLTAAVEHGPAAAEAAWAEPRLAVPAARLKPPRGMVGSFAAALVAAIAWLLPAPQAAAPSPDARSGAARPAPSAAPAAAAGAAEARAARAAERAATERAVREALGLVPEAAADEARVAASLSDPEIVEAVRKALPEGSDEAKRLAADATAAAGELARMLARASSAEAEALRRDAAALRAGAGAASVPPERRALVTRWLASRLEALR
jgi:hypothetical protein